MLQTKKKKRENNWKRKKKSVTKEEVMKAAEANNWSWRANWRVFLCLFGHISGDKNGP